MYTVVVISLLIWLAIVWACFGFGASVLRRLRVAPAGLAEEAPFAVALGMGALSFLVLGAGLLGFLGRWPGALLVAVVAAVGGKHLLRLPREVWAAAAGLRLRRLGAVLLLVFFLASFALTLLGALAPSGDNDYDGLVYHLGIPKVYLRDGRIHFIPWLSHSNFPFGMEMLYLLGLMLRGQALAKLFHFGCAWLIALAVYAFGKRWRGPLAGYLGAAAFVAIPLVGWEAMIAYNDLAFALYAFLTISALSRWRGEDRSAGWLWLAALMCGLALGVKMLAGVVLIFSVIALGWEVVRSRAAGPAAARGAAFVLIALAVAGPWYVKSQVWTGNPVYPFFYQRFGGKYWTAERAEAYTAAQKEFGAGGGPVRFAALPWNLTMNPHLFFDQPQVMRPMNVLIWTFGPLLLALVPLMLLAGPVGRPGWMALGFAALYAAIWFAMSQNGRYLLPILPGLCACAGAAGARLLASGRLALAAAAAAFLLACASGAAADLILSGPGVRAALGLEPPAAYLARTSQAYSFAQAVNRATPPGARILVFGDEPRLFYLERDYLLGDHTALLSARDRGSPGALLAALERLRVTHVLAPQEMMFPTQQPSSGSLEAALQGLVLQGALRPVGEYQGPYSLWIVVKPQ